ncbi:hypothetical protein IV500_01630 [Paeniglutamicibacter antarcticus]|uniref:Uncharacterized protein n=1 Tax=Arthrobacter terrae TaxID=2935737 RepID=A0A931CNM5_9MICC|nr:hypothetical protein [Arthrobacter terrae]MBG0738136.1 hypothetical protein [Arthrobacter terrae]
MNPTAAGVFGATYGTDPAGDVTAQSHQPLIDWIPMSTPEEEPATGEQPPGPGHYGEIAPGVPRYGQYAPPGLQSPAAEPVPSAAPLPGSTQRTAPRQVEVAFWLILAAAVIEALLVILGAFALFTPAGQSTAGQMLRNAGLTDESMLQPLLITALVISAVSVGIYVLLAYQIRRGRNWARITGAVLAAVSLLSLLQPDLITAVQMVLGVVAIILVFLPSVRSYFRH